jgi:TRAP-type C4-dicarboxylate transport system permease small subunit
MKSRKAMKLAAWALTLAICGALLWGSTGAIQATQVRPRATPRPPAAPSRPMFLPAAVAAGMAVGRGLYISRRAWTPHATHVARVGGIGHFATRALHGLFGARLRQVDTVVLPEDVLD